MPNYKLTLCYDGSRYRGWQKQGNTENTIQGRVETALSRLIGEDVELSGSGRTDAGVHARAQVCSFRTERKTDCDPLLKRLREVLPEDIGVISLEIAEPRFHARLSCREKSYVYRVWNSPLPNVFQRRYMYRFEGPLDMAAMEKAAAALIGQHDFASFCSLKKMKKSSVRELYEINIEKLGEEVRFMLRGSGFLYNMVRIIVGTLLEVGSGQRSAGEMGDVLASLDRQRAGFTAPAQGLTLWDAKY